MELYSLNLRPSIPVLQCRRICDTDTIPTGDLEMRIAIGADHAGYELKTILVRWLQSSGHDIVDLGAHKLDPSDDYPDFAATVAQAVASKQADRGIIVCGSGVGASITANKVVGVRACLCHDTYTAHQGVEHDDMNVVCVGARVIGLELAKEVLQSFLSANFVQDPRFQRRLEKVLQLERQTMLGQKP